MRVIKRYAAVEAVTYGTKSDMSDRRTEIRTAHRVFVEVDGDILEGVFNEEPTDTDIMAAYSEGKLVSAPSDPLLAAELQKRDRRDIEMIKGVLDELLLGGIA